MTFSIVKDGRFLHNVGDIPYKFSETFIARPSEVDPDTRKSYGMYDFLPGYVNPPAGKKVQGSTFTVDAVAGTVTEVLQYVDMTADEIKSANNTPLLAQIDALEKNNLLPRIVRDLAKKSLAEDAVAAGITLDQLYASNTPAGIAYKKFKDFDDEIKALREKLM